MANIKLSLASIHENMECRLIADTPATIKKRVAEIAANWQRSFDLDTPKDALESWERRMVRVVDEVAQVATKNPAAFIHE
jgi:hypothetical protein